MWGMGSSIDMIEMLQVKLTTENSRASIFNATSLHGWSTKGAAGGDDGDCGTVVDGDDGEGGGGEGDDGGGGKLGGVSGGSAAAIVMVGASSAVTPSAVEAASAVPRVEESEVSTTSGVKEAGTAMVAVMRTLPAATSIVTNDLSTPAIAAMFSCKTDLSLSE